MNKKTMNKTTPYIDKIFTILKKELKQYNQPIVSKEKKDYPHTPFTTLISCILSLRTKDAVTAKASQQLLSRYDTPEKIQQLSEQTIQHLIYPVGFYKTKAKRIKEIAKTIQTKYQGKVPTSLDELLTLKGVGRKTANIVMVYGHHKHGYLPIDTHCHRIPNRLSWIKTKTPKETEQALKTILPKKYWNDFNDLFVTFGQNICMPISPYCSKCPIEQYCKKNKVTKSR